MTVLFWLENPPVAAILVVPHSKASISTILTSSCMICNDQDAFEAVNALNDIIDGFQMRAFYHNLLLSRRRAARSSRSI